MERTEANAGASITAGSEGSQESSDLTLLQALEAEDTAGRSAETTTELSQEEDSGSPGGDDATGGEAGEGAEGTEDAGESQDEDAEEDEAVPPGRAQKRIAKLVAERNEVRQERDELKTEVDRLKSGAPQPTGPWDPLSGDEEYVQAKQGEEKAQAEYRSARTLLRQLDRDADAVLKVVAKHFKVEEPTVDQARDLLEDYADLHQERLSDSKAKRVAKESEIRSVNQQAAKVWQSEAEVDMPWLKNAKDPRHKHRAAILKAHPWVEHIPAGKWLVAAAAAKLANLEARQRGASQAKPAQSERRIVPGAGRATSQAARASGSGSQRMAAASKRHLENPDDESLSEFLDAAVAG